MLKLFIGYIVFLLLKGAGKDRYNAGYDDGYDDGYCNRDNEDW
ncbi:hypothetical protein SDA24_09825 [Legionella pneumophila serogroup 8]